MPKVVIVTNDWSGLGLGLLMTYQGSDVVFAFDMKDVKPEDREAMETLGNGLVKKMPLTQATRQLLMQKTLWVFDSNNLSETADKLRETGELVIGTSALSEKLENDRDYAAGVAEAIGLKLPETEKFTNYAAALKFLERNRNKAYVYKPYKSDPTATFVPQEADDPKLANEELREYISGLTAKGKPQFILQRMVEGIEVDFDLWLRDGKPKMAFCDLEAKRKLTGDLGENIGCAGGVVFRVPLSCPGIVDTVGKYLKWKDLAHYTGSVDVNVMYTQDGILFLENCFRFGYNAYPAIFQSLAVDKAERILRDWVAGRTTIWHDFSEKCAASLTLVSDHPATGCPILVPENFPEFFYLYRGYCEASRLKMVEGWPEIGCVTATAKGVEEAAKKCLKLTEFVAFPNKGYRTDLADASLPTLPAARYHDLAHLGVFGPVANSY